MLSNVSVIVLLNEDNNVIELPEKLINNVVITKIPIIVKSKYCTYKNDIDKECNLDEVIVLLMEMKKF